MVRRGAQRIPVNINLHSRPGVVVQSIHKDSNEAGRVIFRKEVIEGRWQQLGLLAIHWS